MDEGQEQDPDAVLRLYMARMAQIAEEGARIGLAFVLVGMDVNPIGNTEKNAMQHIGCGWSVAVGMVTYAEDILRALRMGVIQVLPPRE